MTVRPYIGERVLDGVPDMNEQLLLDALRDAHGACLTGGVIPRRDVAIGMVTAGPLARADDSHSALASSLAGAVSQAVLP